jgi:hypothetical protein
LVERILSQAKRKGISLSDVEQKMLYFSETAWTPPDMENVSRKFDEKYDQNKYEAKIASLIRGIKRDQEQNLGDEWERAVDVLRKEDHYVLLLINAADKSSSRLVRPPYDRLKLILTALLVIVTMFAIMYFLGWRSR